MADQDEDISASAGQGLAGGNVRADARRNTGVLIDAAKKVFATSGVDAPVREIAQAAGVGLGTLYRHFPKRSDLIVAVFRREIDACAMEATTLADKHSPRDALSRWINRYVDFIATKAGLEAALRSGDPAYDSLYTYFETHLRPALQHLLDRATAAGVVRPDIDPTDLLLAVARLSGPSHGPEHSYSAKRMIALLLDGLRRTT